MINYPNAEKAKQDLREKEGEGNFDQNLLSGLSVFNPDKKVVFISSESQEEGEYGIAEAISTFLKGRETDIDSDHNEGSLSLYILEDREIEILEESIPGMVSYWIAY